MLLDALGCARKMAAPYNSTSYQRLFCLFFIRIPRGGSAVPPENNLVSMDEGGGGPSARHRAVGHRAVVAAVAGGGCGAILDAVFYGLDSMKLHRHAGTSPPPRLTCPRGFQALHKGFLPVVATGNALGFSLFFFLFESTHHVLLHDLSCPAPVAHLAASACASVPASLITVPSDVLKKRMVLGSERGLWQNLSTLHRAHGWRGLFLGWQVNFYKDVPFAAIKMSLYEELKSWYVCWAVQQRKRRSQPAAAATAAGLRGDASSVSLLDRPDPATATNHRSEQVAGGSSATSHRAEQVADGSGRTGAFRHALPAQSSQQRTAEHTQQTEQQHSTGLVNAAQAETETRAEFRGERRGRSGEGCDGGDRGVMAGGQGCTAEELEAYALSPREAAGVGLASGALTAVCTNPLDVANTYIKTRGADEGEIGLWQATRVVVARRGVLGLFAGLPLRLGIISAGGMAFWAMQAEARSIVASYI
eukprot:g19572.t1